jgi:hypothetical protein
MLELREHFFLAEGVQHVACLVLWRPLSADNESSGRGEDRGLVANGQGRRGNFCNQAGEGSVAPAAGARRLESQVENPQAELVSKPNVPGGPSFAA